jgi:hypothetical protein
MSKDSVGSFLSPAGTAIGGLLGGPMGAQLGAVVGGNNPVGNFIGGGDIPKPAAPPATPNPTDPEVGDEMQDAEEAEKATGETANMLTGGQGLLTPPQTTRAMLMGS